MKHASLNDRVNALFGAKPKPEDIAAQDMLTAAAIAAKQLDEAERDTRFIADVPNSKPTETQRVFIDSFTRYEYSNYYVRGGNQCLVGETLVATPAGPRRIDALKVGDYVLDPCGKPIEVLATYDNGEKEVFDYINRGRTIVTCTDKHKFLTYKFSPKKGVDKSDKRVREVGAFAAILHNHSLRQLRDAQSISADDAWAYGALQGDGCCTCGRGNRIVISSADSLIPNRLADICNSKVRKLHKSNFNWDIEVPLGSLPLYEHMFENKYAHEKHLPDEVLQNLDTKAAMAYLAGLLDTDGSLAADEKAKACYICWTTQNALAANGVQYLLLKFFGIEAFIHIDARPKYKNGDILSVKVTNPHDILQICKGLEPYCVLKRKIDTSKFETFGSKSSPDSTSVQQAEDSKRTARVFNITVNHPENLYQLANGLISKNSGKSHTCAYLIAKLLQETLPNWKRRPKWEKAPLLLIWLSRQGKQIEGSLWPKCKSYLKPGSYREHRQGGSLQYVEMLSNGNKLFFISYENVNSARDAVQSFTAHYVFLDELPPKAHIIEEAQNRLIVNSGIFVAAFTPKRPAPEVKRLVENADKRFNTGFSLLVADNPGVSPEDLERQRLKAAQYGSKMEASILTGEWVDGEHNVFYIDESRVVRNLPYDYTENWVHWESSDPANVSGFGLIVAAQDPTTKCWYIVKAKTLSGPDIECPSISVTTIKRETAKYNVVKRIYDSAAASYATEARRMGLKYTPCMSKWKTFEDSVDSLQEAIGRKVFLTPECQDLLDELANYQRAEDNPEKVINRKKFHLVDAFRYFTLAMPREKAQTPTEEGVVMTDGELTARLLDMRTGGDWQHTPNKEKPKQTFMAKLQRRNTQHWRR